MMGRLSDAINGQSQFKPVSSGGNVPMNIAIIQAKTGEGMSKHEKLETLISLSDDTPAADFIEWLIFGANVINRNKENARKALLRKFKGKPIGFLKHAAGAGDLNAIKGIGPKTSKAIHGLLKAVKPIEPSDLEEATPEEIALLDEAEEATPEEMALLDEVEEAPDPQEVLSPDHVMPDGRTMWEHFAGIDEAPLWADRITQATNLSVDVANMMLKASEAFAEACARLDEASRRYDEASLRLERVAKRNEALWEQYEEAAPEAPHQIASNEPEEDPALPLEQQADQPGAAKPAVPAGETDPFSDPVPGPEDQAANRVQLWENASRHGWHKAAVKAMAKWEGSDQDPLKLSRDTWNRIFENLEDPDCSEFYHNQIQAVTQGVD